MSPLMLSYIGESRRMDNRKMLDKLGIDLLYSDLESGLRAGTPSPSSPPHPIEGEEG